MKFLQKVWLPISLLLLSLTPVFWFYKKGNSIINGVDTNFPLDPLVWFLRRFYVWNDITNGGANFASSTAGIIFHLIQVIPFVLGLDLQSVQIVSFLFWFITIIFTTYLLSREIIPSRPLIQLFMVVIYVFNTYLFNTWENVKVANLSLVAALPLGVYILISLQRESIGIKKAAILSIITGVLLSGSGINPAYFLAFFLGFWIIAICDIAYNIDLAKAKKKLFNVLLINIFIVLVNFFWIFPTLQYIFSNISSNGSINDIGFTNWINSLSENTSLLNIIRLQGAWDWYSLDDKTGAPLYIPYAINYFNKLPFIIFSFIMPAIVALSFVFFRNKRDGYLYLSFGVLLLTGIFLGAGTHPPTGPIFKFMSLHLPFFSLFRSPWYIFTPLTIISYAVLGSLFFANLDQRLISIKFWNKWKLLPLIIISMILGNLLYSYPLVTGKIFRPGREDSFYVKIPEYVINSKKILNNKAGRIISYPDDEIENFKWGYRGVESITQLISDREILYSPLNSTNSPIAGILKELYSNLKKGETESAKLLATKLGADTLLDKEDQKSLAPVLTEKIKATGNDISGEWKFYNFPTLPLPKIYSATEVFLTDLSRKQKFAKTLTVIPDGSLIANKGDGIMVDNNFLGLSNEVIISSNSQSEDLNQFNQSFIKLSNSLHLRDLSTVTYTFTIPHEGTFQPILERYKLEEFGFNLNRDLECYINGEKKTLIIDKIDDSKVYIKPVFFNQGLQEIRFRLNQHNLVDNNIPDSLMIGHENILEKRKEESLGFEYFTLLNQSPEDISIKMPVRDFDPYAIYLLQYKYKHLFGLKPHLMAEQFNKTSPIKHQMEVMPFATDWTDFSIYFTPVGTESSLNIDPYIPASKEALGTKVAFADFYVSKVFINDLILVGKNNTESVKAPEIHFSKQSPVMYLGDVKKSNNRHVIVFAENFSNDWKIAIYKEKNKLLYQPDHFTCNLYANCWIIEGMPENYHFEIYYEPQKLFQKGIVVSITGPLFLLLVIILKEKYYDK